MEITRDYNLMINLHERYCFVSESGKENVENPLEDSVNEFEVRFENKNREIDMDNTDKSKPLSETKGDNRKLDELSLEDSKEVLKKGYDIKLKHSNEVNGDKCKSMESNKITAPVNLVRY